LETKGSAVTAKYERSQGGPELHSKIHARHFGTRWQAITGEEDNSVTADDSIPKPKALCLDQFLKLTSIAESGGQAKVMIQSGEVKVNGEVETRRRRKLVAEDVVEAGSHKWLVKDSVARDFSQ
jgi:ribosome-associated protein